MGFTRSSSKRLAVIDDHKNSSPQRVDNDCISTKLNSYNLFSVVVFVYTIRFHRASSRSAAIVEIAQCIAAARRKQCYRCEALIIRSFLGHGSRLLSMKLSCLSSSKLLVIDPVCNSSPQRNDDQLCPVAICVQASYLRF